MKQILHQPRSMVTSQPRITGSVTRLSMARLEILAPIPDRSYYVGPSAVRIYSTREAPMSDHESWNGPQEIDAGIPAILQATRPWVKTMSIFGFITVGFMVLMGLIMGIAGAASGQVSFLLIMVVYPAMGLLYLFPALYLFRFSSRINDFLADRSLDSLAGALEQQRVFWKFVTLMVIISTAAGITFALLAGVIAGMMGM